MSAPEEQNSTVVQPAAILNQVDYMRQENAMVQCNSNDWWGQKSQKIRTEKGHLPPMRTSEELNSTPHPLFSMG